jgi:hypothetical protein
MVVCRESSVHIDDVVEAHLEALDPIIPDGSEYVLAGKGNPWKRVTYVVQRDYVNLGARMTPELEEEFLINDSRRRSRVGDGPRGIRWCGMW